MKIAVASGKGGTGKTFVSTNLFYVAQKERNKTIIVDCDAEEPNVLGFLNGEIIENESVFQKIPIIDTNKCTFCGLCSKYCEFNAILILPTVQFIQVTPELCHNCGACSFACKFGAITETDLKVGETTEIQYSENSKIIESKVNIGIERPNDVIKFAQQKAENKADFIIYDSPPGTSCPFIATVENSDIVILVAEPTPFGLNDLMISVEVLKNINKKTYAIINKHGIGNDDVENFLKSQNIKILAKIPYDKTIAEKYSVGNILAKEDIKYYDIFKNVLKKLNI